MSAVKTAAKELLTIGEAAERADCHSETIRRAVRSGELPAHQDRLKSGHPYMIAVDDLERFIEARRS